ncbi:MAG TPA: hypothetical protein VF054_03390 [Micromonosporaceae bacterium]
MKVADQALARLSSSVAPDVLDAMRRLARAHESAFIRGLGELSDALDLGKYVVDPKDLLTGTDHGSPWRVPKPSRTPDYTVPHDSLLGTVPRTSDGKPFRNAGPGETGDIRDLGSASRPSPNPQDWVGGAGSQDGTTYEMERIDSHTVRMVWRLDNGSFVEVVKSRAGGYEVETIFTYEAASRQQLGETSLSDEHGLVLRTTYVVDADGSTRGSTTVRNGATYTTYVWEKDPEGRPVDDGVEKTSGDDLKKGVATLPGTDSGPASALARALARKFDHSKKADPPVVTYIDPASPEHRQPAQAPRLKPGPGVVDVQQEHAADAGRARIEHWQEELRDKVGGIVDPPGPQVPGKP